MTNGAAPPPELNSAEGLVAAEDGAGLCESEDGVSEAEQEQLRRAMVAGTDAERYDALQQLLSAGFEVPAEQLLAMYTADPSEDIRMLAFTTYVDAVSADPAAVHEALLSGTVNSSAAVQAEARARLVEYARYQEMVAETPQQEDVP